MEEQRQVAMILHITCMKINVYHIPRDHFFILSLIDSKDVIFNDNTASTCVYLDSNKKLKSITNAVGYLYNSGSSCIFFVVCILLEYFCSFLYFFVVFEYS